MKRFFFHYFKAKQCMSIHFDKQCIPVKDVICEAPCETKWNIRQPRLTMRGWADRVDVVKGVGYIRRAKKHAV